jgi:hypothetical protein
VSLFASDQVPLSARGKPRVLFIDAARGAAMFFVLLAHFGFSFFDDRQARLPTILKLVSMVASPTFMILSGMLVGFLYQLRPASFERLRLKLADRGLFILTVGHLVLLASHVPFYTIRFLSITDTIAICMVVQPWLVMRVSARGRVLLALSLYAASWTLAVAWHPAGTFATLFKDIAFGTFDGRTYFVYQFSVVPWFSLDLAATALGGCLGRYYVDGERAAAQRLLLTTATIAVVSAVVAKVAFFVAVHAHPEIPWLVAGRGFLSPFSKDPPSPVYIAFYGGLGLYLLSFSFFLECRGALAAHMERVAIIGRTSLFVFLSHWFVYLVVVMGLRSFLPFRWAWPVYFVLSCVPVIWASSYWYRKDYNRFFTVGLARVLDRRRPSARPRIPTFEQAPSTAI